MNVHDLDTGEAERERLERSIASFPQAVDGLSAQAALANLESLHLQHDSCVTSLKARLLGTSLAWSQEEISACEWIHGTNQTLARIAQRLLQALPQGTEQSCRAAAFALHFRGESMKNEIALGRTQIEDFAWLNAIMKDAMASGRHHDPMHIQVEGHRAPCCIESLFFRALLLARCAGGNLSAKQIRILDAWIWIWMPVLVSTPNPQGPAMGVDLESNRGLRRSIAGTSAATINLPLIPIQEAYRAILAQFHQGRIVPAHGLTAAFRIEEHLVVIDLLRRALRSWLEETTPRAARAPASVLVEMQVGIAEILKKAFRAPPVLAAAAAEGGPFAAAYDTKRRQLHLVDKSATGLGLDGASKHWSDVMVADLVALRIPDEPLVLGRVARCIPSLASDGVTIGISRLPGTCLPVRVTRTSSDPGDPGFDLLYVSGDDMSGRDDAYLVPDIMYADRTPLRVTAGGSTFTFRFNRIRQRGRGWVLAGIEIISSQPVQAVAA